MDVLVLFTVSITLNRIHRLAKSCFTLSYASSGNEDALINTRRSNVRNQEISSPKAKVQPVGRLLGQKTLKCKLVWVREDMKEKQYRMPIYWKMDVKILDLLHLSQGGSTYFCSMLCYGPDTLSC